ncbi:alpha/beta-hydrolase [Auriscalpium vulgare]|uniref:Alpha/beta-hydrolase n=1 Tax=Auriscalpium vulgare TaxID=40419 RepID=A0ACB8S0R4_9AGAM|nr:alpha/beta-hydrolase [Auriscalpium vulgare]
MDFSADCRGSCNTGAPRPAGCEFHSPCRQASSGIEDVILDPVTSKAYYAQKRPAESGRSVVVDAEDGQDLFDLHWDARTQVHGYGGAAAAVYDDVLYFSNLYDGRVYECEKGVQPTAITSTNSALRFADFAVFPDNPILVISIVEDHTNPHPARVVTTLAAINASKLTITTLVEGSDFYTCPRFSPDGSFLVWQQWDHPDLPWQGAEIVVAPCSMTRDRRTLHVGPHIHIAGQPGFVSAVDPGWISYNTLYFTSDISGFHNPWTYTFDPANPSDSGKSSPIAAQPIEEEFGAPQWWLSQHGSGALNDTTVAFLSFRDAKSRLYLCDLLTGTITEIPTPYAHIQYMHGDAKGRVVMLGQPADCAETLVELVLDDRGNPVLKPVIKEDTSITNLLPFSVSIGQQFALSLAPDERTCHVSYYPPKSAIYDGGFPEERPPVVVFIHGGPHFMDPLGLDLGKQFFTSRGWAYVSVNYRGSSGFGRQYREAINGNWGLIDAQDALESICKLDEMGLVDSRRAVVHGGCAGGYTVLQIATMLPDAFAAAAPQYGISDLRNVDNFVHKFEYQLCDKLIGGKYSECPDIWHQRSPIHHANRIKMPLLAFQAVDDRVMLADPMVKMVKAIEIAGGKAELVLFPDGRNHAKTVQAVLEKELAFFKRVLGLDEASG